MEIGAKTKVVGVIGWPLGHTLSPPMHNAAFEKAGLDWVYVALPTPPETLEEAIRGMKALGMTGLNVTIPHKEAVMEFLDEVKAEAKQIGAVNTIWVEDGNLCGTNTDAYGFLASLDDEGVVRLENKAAAIIGSGGVARAIVTACASEGMKALALTDIVIERAHALEDAVTKSFPQITVNVFEPEHPDLYDAVSSADVLVNATPLGMKPDDPLPIEAEHIRSGSVVFDAVYNPAETKLLAAAARKECKAIGGLGMLAHQGARSFEIWTGVAPDVELMKEVLKQKLFG